MKVTWKVRLHIVSLDPNATKQKSAEHVDTFGIEAEPHDYDGAKRAAIAWLTDRKRKIRAINFIAPKKQGDPPLREMIAYVMPLEDQKVVGPTNRTA